MLQTPPRGELGYPAPVLAVQVERRTELKNRTGGHVLEVELTGYNQGLHVGLEGERKIKDDAKDFLSGQLEGYTAGL